MDGGAEMRYEIKVTDRKTGAVEIIESDRFFLPHEASDGMCFRSFFYGNSVDLARLSDVAIRGIAISIKDHPEVMAIMDNLAVVDGSETIVDMAAIEEMKEDLK